MKYMLISIFDRAVNAFQPIANVRAHGEALRVFRDLIANPQSQQHAHADDYDLWHMGYFDDTNGRLEPIDPVKIADGKTTKEMLQTN